MVLGLSQINGNGKSICQNLCFFLFFFFFFTDGVSDASEPRPRRVGAVSEKRKKKRDTAGHRKLARRPRSGVRHVSDADTTPKMACPCNLIPLEDTTYPKNTT